MELLRPTATIILIYYHGYVACLTPLEHQELVPTLDEPARKKILAKTRRLRTSPIMDSSRRGKGLALFSTGLEIAA